MFAADVFNVRQNLRITGLRLAQHVAWMWNPLVGTLASSALALWVDSNVNRSSHWCLVLTGGIMGASYLAWIWLTGRLEILIDLWSTLRSSRMRPDSISL